MVPGHQPQSLDPSIPGRSEQPSGSPPAQSSLPEERLVESTRLSLMDTPQQPIAGGSEQLPVNATAQSSFPEQSVRESTPKSSKGGNYSDHRSTWPPPVEQDPDHKFWVDDLRTHYTSYGGNITEYLETYVPSTTPYIPNPIAMNNPFGIPIVFKPENLMYPMLRDGMKKLMKAFEPRRKLSFGPPTHITPVVPEHGTEPDIPSTYPGLEVPSKWEWHHCPLVLEAKSTEEEDPIEPDESRKATASHEKTLVQAAKSGRSILHASMGCFSFVVGVYGPNMRIYRFDHAGLVISPSFDYTTNPDILRQFLWRLVHPIHGIPNTVVGWDNTCTRPSAAEWKTISQLGLIQTHFGTGVDAGHRMETLKHTFLWVDIPWGQAKFRAPVPQSSEEPSSETLSSSSSEGTRTRCLVFDEPVYQSSGIFARATCVRRAILDGDDNQLYALKDSWRERHRTPEGDIYATIQQKIDTFKTDKEEHIGVATCVSAEDVGADLNDVNGHATNSVRLRKTQLGQDHGSELERNHERLLLTPLGDRITSFPSSKVLVQVLRDTIRGHELVHECGILHRDISSGNVMIGPNQRGYLFDFDYSTPVSSDDKEVPEGLRKEIDKKLKELTGTRQFMAMDFFDESLHERDGYCVHLSKHDLESFFWLLIYTVLRYMESRENRKDLSPTILFNQLDDYNAVSVKEHFLMDDCTPAFVNNQPLSQLIARLVWIFRSHVGHSLAGNIDHQNILRTYDLALTSPGWPDNDGSILYVPLPAIKDTRQEDLTESKKPMLEAWAAAGLSRGMPALTYGAEAPEAEGLKVENKPPISLRRSTRNLGKSAHDPGKSILSGNPHYAVRPLLLPRTSPRRRSKGAVGGTSTIGLPEDGSSGARNGLLGTSYDPRSFPNTRPGSKRPALGPPESIPPADLSCMRSKRKRLR